MASPDRPYELTLRFEGEIVQMPISAEQAAQAMEVARGERERAYLGGYVTEQGEPFVTEDGELGARHEREDTP